MKFFKSVLLFSSFISVIFLFIFFILSCKQAPTDAPAITTQIAGKVTDKQTNQPIVGAQITTNPVTSSVVTGADGNYTIPDVKPSQYTITAKKDAYNDNTTTVTVTEGKTVNADIQLNKLSPELDVSPLTLDFETTKTDLTFFITNKGKVGTVTWVINSDQPWITISPKSGTTTTETDPIQVSVSRSSIAVGNYSAQIKITSDAGDKTVNVLMTKPNPSAPQLSISPNTIDFGASLATSQVELKNTGTGAMTWTSSIGASWITLSSTSGNINAGDKTIINVSVNKSGLTPGNYNNSVIFNSNGGQQNLAVSMIVPQGTLTAPTLQLNGEPTTNSVSIGWTKNTDPQFQSYKIFRSITPGVTESSTLVTTITSANNNLYIDNNLQGGTTYYYRVFVYSNSGIGSGSNELSASTSKNLGNWVATLKISSIIDTYSNTIYPNSMFVLSDDNVWIAANNEIWHSDGATWTKVFTVTSYYNKIKAIFFLNPNLGWVVGENGMVFQYNGITWTEVFSGAFYESFGSPTLFNIIAFSSNDIWIGSQSGKLFHYLNGQWLKTVVNANNIIGLDYYNQNNIWALDSDGKVFKYNGVGWALVQSLTGGSFKQIKVIINNDIWIATSSGGSESNSGLWHSDGGLFISNYKLQNGVYYSSCGAIDFISSNEGWRSKSSSFSYFDGTNWRDIVSPVSSPVECIKFLNNKSGWAITYSGDILRYKE